MNQKLISGFKGPFKFLSNFWISEVTLYGILYPTVEHAYQASKTLNETERREILQASTPGKAKRLGQKVTLREDWEQVKLQIMESLLRQKFSYPLLKLNLAQTKGFELIEDNNWGDVYWGVCNGIGENHLGKLLMKIRDGGI